MQDLKVRWTEDGLGNKHTEVQYRDDAGWNCATRLNGHVGKLAAVASIQSFRQRAKSVIY